ncbi:MAG: beta-ketoacyl-ACP synthase III [Pseudomonadota bacterium]
MAGCGAYLPERVLTNAELATLVDTSDDWIVERSGIRERRIAAENERTSDLAIRAGQEALDACGVAAGDVDAVIVATSTPDLTFPATATRVQSELGAHRAFAFDQQAVCSGFIFAVSTADALIAAGRAETVLVIGAETFSRLLDWTDRGTCVLFGDGAGAVVMRAGAPMAAPQPEAATRPTVSRAARPTARRGVLAIDLNTDGRQLELLYVDGGPGSNGLVGKLRMQGREVFRHAVTNLAATARTVMALGGVSAEEVDWIVPHQANIRILEGTARKLGVPRDRLVVSLDRHGNTSAASIPLALHDAVSDGRIREGDLLLMEAMGGGMTWGSALVRW